MLGPKSETIPLRDQCWGGTPPDRHHQTAAPFRGEHHPDQRGVLRFPELYIQQFFPAGAAPFQRAAGGHGTGVYGTRPEGGPLRERCGPETFDLGPGTGAAERVCGPGGAEPYPRGIAVLGTEGVFGTYGGNGPLVRGHQKGPTTRPCTSVCGGAARGPATGQGHIGSETGVRARAKCPGAGEGVGLDHRDLYGILWGESPGDPGGGCRCRRYRPWRFWGHIENCG